MKKLAILLLAPCMILAGCSHSQDPLTETRPITLEVESIPSSAPSASPDTETGTVHLESIAPEPAGSEPNVSQTAASEPTPSETPESQSGVSPPAVSESTPSETPAPEPAGSETPASQPAESETPAPEPAGSETAVTVSPLPDPTMDTLDQGTFAISLKEGDAYVDDAGIMQMDVTVYTYDLYDMVDISGLKTGDIIVTHSGEITVTSIERTESGTLYINGGLDAGGFDLSSNDGGVYYETGYNDIKSWYAVGEVTLRVSSDFEFRDNMDLDKGEQIYYAGSFLTGEVTDYYFMPHNTTIRTEHGEIVSMERIYTP